MISILTTSIVYTLSSQVAAASHNNFKGSSNKAKNFILWSSIFGFALMIASLVMLFLNGPWWAPIIVFFACSVTGAFLSAIPFSGLIASLCVWAMLIVNIVERL